MPSDSGKPSSHPETGDESPATPREGERPLIGRREFLKEVGAGGVAVGFVGLDGLDLIPARRAELPRRRGRSYAIYPALGVARLGNAPFRPEDPSVWYLGAESPYEVPNQGKPYKTGGLIKKQAQRFRIYELENGRATREITLGEADVAAIVWTVHLANRKAAFDPSMERGSVSRPEVLPAMPRRPEPDSAGAAMDERARYFPAKARNAHVQPEHRDELAIDPGPRSVLNPGESRELAGSITLRNRKGEPISKSVTLGHLHSEPETGRLLVFAGDGVSEGVLEDPEGVLGSSCVRGQLSEFAPLSGDPNEWVNNDNWHDDTADGWVRAEITFRDGTRVALDQPEQSAWVICASPRFAPGINQFTSLHDVATSAFHAPGTEIPRPSFTRDIYPIFRSASLLSWVNARASLGHSPGRGGYLLSEDLLRRLGSNDPGNSDAARLRARVFSRIRNPEHYVITAETSNDMPRLPMEVVESPGGSEGMPWDIGAVTPLQYAQLREWAAGRFEADGIPGYVPLDEMDTADQPAALDRAALEATCGTPFFPGIESWKIVRERALYADAPLRMSARVSPGDLTIGNAVPWQADYLDCTDAWWPVQRPTEVTRNGVPAQSWAPPEWKEHADVPEYGEMIRHWWDLGFIVSTDGGASYREVEREIG